ncbi:MAG: hypothetical protein DMENIID0002_05830 [Rickettsia endosymbiont of Sergentomyia squamirostris]|uniref:Uncharacterized protein n=1 Tax=Candidatus Tisiphia endosymbiont of Sergentomyia squamirostris TaxID=3113639 RepID=A0AAT9G7Y5_9RICK
MRLRASKCNPIAKLLNIFIDIFALTPFRNNQSIIKILTKKKLLMVINKELRVLLSLLLIKGVTKFSIARSKVDKIKKLGVTEGYITVPLIFVVGLRILAGGIALY